MFDIEKIEGEAKITSKNQTLLIRRPPKTCLTKFSSSEEENVSFVFE